MMTDNAVSNPAVDVDVTDAQHHGDGRGKYTSYLVEARAPMRTAVRRRYSDFKWLYQRLLEERAGSIVPIIPHKQALTSKMRFSDELVSERQQQLQQFLTSVMKHPELHDAPSLQTFLTADYTVWENAKKQHGEMPGEEDESGDLLLVDGPKKTAGNRISNWMGKVASQARSKLALASGMELESTPDDDIFNDLHAYANNLEQNVKILAKNSTILVQAIKTQSEKMEQMGAAFSEMGEYKLENDVIVRTSSTTMLTKVGQNWNNLSKLCNFQHQSGVTKLDEPIQDLARDVMALKIAISKRREILYHYTRKAHQGKKKMGQLDKMRENAPSFPEVIVNMEGEIKTLKEEGAELWKEVEVVSKRLSRDAERFKLNFHEKIRSAMESFHKVQVEYSEKYVQGYGDVLSDLAPIQSNGLLASAPPSSADGPVTATL